MIQVQNVSKVFTVTKQLKKELGIAGNSVKAVDDISFECKPGRIFSLLGPNGAGKTTLLRLIATILKPSSGNINVAGFDTVNSDRDVRQRIGFITGSTGLYERLTTNELVKYFADLYGVEKDVFEKRKRELFDILGIDGFSTKKIGQLSTGMKQKVSLVRTMIHDPEVIVFDEPTSGLDVIAAKNIIELIKRCKDQNKTVIFSSHIMSEVDLLCDDLAIIHKGKLLYNDTMDNFRKQMTTRNLTEEFIHIVETYQN
ncbi:MAG TPA: ATP-binding cassette domain-containing protein [Bacteroidales bacterium]|nr:ATP-binding cassette domain-containing protein [Bacteroidales bacterium]